MPEFMVHLCKHNKAMCAVWVRENCVNEKKKE